MNYTAIIGDIKESRKLKNRDYVQKKLEKTLQEINKEYAFCIEADFLITLGDEFQGLLNDTKKSFQIVEIIKKKMFPTEIRFGIGIGEITTNINRSAAIGADGPAYYAARDVLNEIKEKEKTWRKEAPDIQIDIYEGDSLDKEIINTFLLLLKTIENNWDDEQRITIWDMEDYQYTQVELAKKLHVDQATVSRRLSIGNIKTYKHTKKILGELLDNMETDK